MAFIHIYQQWLKKQEYDQEKVRIYSQKVKVEKDLQGLQRDQAANPSSNSLAVNIYWPVMTSLYKTIQLIAYFSFILWQDLKIDWHDWDFIANDLKRIGTQLLFTLQIGQIIFISFLSTGPGEQGTPVHLSKEEEKVAKLSYDGNGFNGYASDQISLDRAIKDIRHPL